MSHAAHPSLLRRLMGLSSAAPAAEVDPADMGTAMGLDYCLDEPPADVLAASAAPHGGSATQAGWLRRLSAS